MLAKLSHCHYKRITIEGIFCVDSRVAEHIFLDYTYFLSYRPSIDPNNCTLLGDKSRCNIAGHGKSIFTMIRCLVLVRNTVYIPCLWLPIYSTQRHRTQPGFTYYDDDTIGNLLLFLTIVIDVESTTGNIFSFRPISLTLRDRKLD